MKTDTNETKVSLFEQIYEVVRQIPQGRVVTYGEVAKRLGLRDVRKVGWALHQNPYEFDVPCHRVVNKEGRLAKNFGFGGAEEQKNRLEAEGVKLGGEDRVNLEEYGYSF